jgi:hypothetical protein
MSKYTVQYMQSMSHRSLKETVSRDFRPRVFHQTIPTRPLIYALKYFRIRRDINENVWSSAMRHSAEP